MAVAGRGARTAVRRGAGVWRLVRSVVPRVPFTVSVLALMLVFGVVTAALWSPVEDSPWWDRLAYGLSAFQAGRWWTVGTGSLVATVPAQYVPVGLGFALLVGFAELRLGTRRTAIVTITGQAAGVIGAAALLAILQPIDWEWARGLAGALDCGFSAGALCALTVAAYSLHAPWRARLLFVVLGYTVVNLLFVGVLWDVEHAIAVALGLVIGRRTDRIRARGTGLRMSRREWRLFAAAMLALVAASQLVVLALPGSGPLGAEPFTVQHRLPVAVLVLVQLLVAAGLSRGSRLAWQLALLCTAIGVVSSALLAPRARQVVGVLAYAVIAAILLHGRRAFTAPASRAASAWAARWGILTLGALAAYATLGFTVLHFEPEPTRREAAQEVLARLFFSTTGAFHGTTRAATLFLESLSVAWLVALVAFLVAVLLRARRPRPSSDRETAVQLLTEYGGPNLSWMATWPDHAHFLTADRRASIAYQVHQGVALALGDPVGQPEARVSAVAAFVRHCERLGLVPCLFASTSAVLPQVAALGWRWAQVAEDTVIDLPGLSFQGRAWQDVRTAQNRARRVGITFRLGTLADAPFAVVAQVRGICEQWVGDRGLPEMGFTLGGVEEALDPEVLVGLAIDPRGTVHGVTSWLPVHGPGGPVIGRTLDLMRRRPDGFRPVVEFLIAEACLAFREQGLLTVSLSGAPLARADSSGPRTPVDEMLDRLGARLEPYYGFRSLHQFKAKFQPRYEPMYLCFRDEAALPRIGLALARAYLRDVGIRDLPALVRSGGRDG